MFLEVSRPELSKWEKSLIDVLCIEQMTDKSVKDIVFMLVYIIILYSLGEHAITSYRMSLVKEYLFE